MKHCDPPPLLRSFLKKIVIGLSLLACLLALEGVNTSAHAATAGEPVYGCPSGYACIYPQDKGVDSSTPEHQYYRYGVYKLHNEIGNHYIVNNQYGGAVILLCTDWNGKTCPTVLSVGDGAATTLDLTPINSIVLAATNLNPPPPPQPPPPAPQPQPKSVKVLVFKDADAFPCIWPPQGRAAGCGSIGTIHPDNKDAYCQLKGGLHTEGFWNDRKNNWWTLIQDGNRTVWVSNLDIKGGETIDGVPQGVDECKKNAPPGSNVDGAYHP